MTTKQTPSGATVPQDAVVVLPPPTRGQRAAVALLIVGTTALYLWRITVNGMANPFYAASAWAGTRNWEALFFGSVDPSNFITVDKPPVSQWIMGLSGRLFGFSSASMLVPQALLGVATVWFCYATAARVAGRSAGLLSGAALALTPVAAMMFRYDNPDAAMVFFMVLGAWACVRGAQSRARAGWWLALAGGAMGLAFLAKMLEGLMSLPALVLLYLLAARSSWPRKILHLLVASVALVVSSGWYVLVTILWPASSRPYLAGSTDNSFLNLVFGYNGLARVQGKGGKGTGSGSHASTATSGTHTWQGSGATGTSGWATSGTHTGLAGSHGGFGGMGSAAGPTRLFTGEFGLEISWLIPAALVGLVAVLVLLRRRPRNDLLRATAAMAGTWMLLDGAVLSFMSGTTHAYYSLAIAPAIAWCAALGAVVAWRARGRLAGRMLLALEVLAAGGWGAWLLLTQADGWKPWIGWTVLALAVAGAALVVLGQRLGRTARRGGLVVLVLGVLAALGAPAAVAVDSVGVSHTGGSPSVQPGNSKSAQDRTGSSAAGGWSGTSAGRSGLVRTSSADSARAWVGTGERQLDDPALIGLLQQSHDTWSAAVSTTSVASELELASRTSVMGIGGFTGQDPAPSLAQFQADVKAHRIGYYVVLAQAGGDGSSGRSGAGSTTGGATGSWQGMRSSNGVGAQIQKWVQANFKATTVGRATVYRLG